MFARRKSPRLIALLVYALAVNAFAWAASASHRADAASGLWCGSLTSGIASTASAPQFPPDRAICDLACAVAAGAAVDAPVAASRLAGPAPAIAWGLPVVAVHRLIPASARGPPMVDA
jgi:hypothetical protein